MSPRRLFRFRLVFRSSASLEAPSFRRTLLRRQEKVSLEWTLVSTSHNLERHLNLGMKLRKYQTT